MVALVVARLTNVPASMVNVPVKTELLLSWMNVPVPILRRVVAFANRLVNNVLPVMSRVGSVPANEKVFPVVAPAIVTRPVPVLLTVNRFRLKVPEPILFVDV